MNIDEYIDKHIEAFVKSFVIWHKQDRWRMLLAKNNQKTLRQSHKLLGHLDPNFMTKDDELSSLDTMDVYCVFYNVGRDEPYKAHLQTIVQADIWGDCIFSIDAGKKAIFMFHHGENFILEK